MIKIKQVLSMVLITILYTFNIYSQCSHSAVANVTEPDCSGNNGSIEVIVTGGTPPYQYNIDGGANQSSNIFNNLSFGGYAIQVIDNSSCVLTIQAVVNYKPVSILSMSSSPTCKDYLAGSISIMAQDGNHIYDYSVDGGNTWQSSTPIQGLDSGLYIIKVRDGLGCLYDSSIHIGYSTINPILTTSNELCDGTLGTINVSFPNTGNYEYTIDGGLNKYTDPTKTYDVSGGNYNFQVTNDDGCIETVPVFVDIDSIHGTISNIQNETCNYMNGAFSIDITDAIPPIEYSIDNGNSFGAINSFNNLDEGIYFIVAKDSRTCKYESYVEITNTGGVELNLSIDTTEICLGKNAIILSSTSTPNCSYEWSNGLGIDTMINVSPTQNEDYSLVVTDPSGCKDTAYAHIIVHPIPNVNISESIINLCPYDSILLTASGATNYVWNTGDTTETIYLKYPFTGSYINVIGASFGCPNKDSAIVNVGGVNASMSENQNICIGSNTILYVNATGNNLTYQWSAGNSTSFSQNVSPTTTTNYRVIVSDDVGCKDTVNSTVFVDDLTNVEVTPNVINGCVGDEVTLYAVGASNFIWNNEDSTNNISFVINENTEIELVGYNVSCSETVTIPVITKPNPEVMISANTTSINTGDQILFSNAGSNATYTEWNFGDGNTSILDNPIHTYNFQGGYNVVLTGYIGNCTNTDTLLVYVGFVGVEENKYEIKLGPNPTNSIFNASILLQSYSDVSVSIYNIKGERLLYDNKETTDFVSVYYDFSHYKKGLYLIEFNVNGNSIVKKIIVN